MSESVKGELKRNHTENDSAASGAISFRPMVEQDIPIICIIEQESFPTPWTKEAFYNELVYNHFAKYFVIQHNHEVIGYGGMWLIMDEAHITNIALRPHYRGKKLGEQLLQHLMARALALGARKMTLEVRVSNTVAQKLYEKHHFKAEGLRKGYYSDNNEDAIIMWADLTSLA